MDKISNDQNFGESVHHFSSRLGAFIIYLSLWGEKKLPHSRPGPGVDQKSLKGEKCFWIFIEQFGAYFCWNWGNTQFTLLLWTLKLRQIHWHNPSPLSPRSLLLIRTLHPDNMLYLKEMAKADPKCDLSGIPPGTQMLLWGPAFYLVRTGSGTYVFLITITDGGGQQGR